MLRNITRAHTTSECGPFTSTPISLLGYYPELPDQVNGEGVLERGLLHTQAGHRYLGLSPRNPVPKDRQTEQDTFRAPRQIPFLEDMRAREHTCVSSARQAELPSVNRNEPSMAHNLRRTLIST